MSFSAWRNLEQPSFVRKLFWPSSILTTQIEGFGNFMAISCMDAFFFSMWQEPITPQLHTNLPSWKKIGGLHTPLARLTFVNAYLESPGPTICWSFQPKRCWSSYHGSDCHDARAACYFSKHVGWKYDGTVLPQPIQHVSPFFGKDRDDCFGGGPHKVVRAKGFIICRKDFWYTEPCWKEDWVQKPDTLKL